MAFDSRKTRRKTTTDTNLYSKRVSSERVHLNMFESLARFGHHCCDDDEKETQILVEWFHCGVIDAESLNDFQ